MDSEQRFLSIESRFDGEKLMDERLVNQAR
jgi:hypothetical protein